MTQLDMIPAKPFSEIESANLRRYAVAPYGTRNRVLRANKDTVTACLRAEVDRQSVRVRSHRRVKHREPDQALPLGAHA